jgi:hypothetical protein
MGEIINEYRVLILKDEGVGGKFVNLNEDNTIQIKHIVNNSNR